MMLFAYADFPSSVQSDDWQPMPGLALTLPPAAMGADLTLVTLNVPNPYASGGQYPGGQFAFEWNGQLLPFLAAFTASEASPESSGRTPTTLVAPLMLRDSPTTLVAVWSSIRGSTLAIDSIASLSALVTSTGAGASA
jgi:mannose-binding lectin